MKHIQEADNLVIKSWCDNPECGAIDQAKNLARLPFAFHHIALMPDTHQGYGMPIGGVLATQGVVIPNAVGVDIGCGVSAAHTSLREISTQELKDLLTRIRGRVPVGFNKHADPQPEHLMPQKIMTAGMIIEREHMNARRSLGTMGGNNHFIEIQKGDDGHIWIMLHSGSRNLGKQVCDHYNHVAVQLNERYHSSVPKKWELAFLPLDDALGQSYLQEMQYCVEFAAANRRVMMERIFEEMYLLHPDFEHGPVIDVAHNYATMENHFGRNVMVHRKGATSARLGQIGIIPGSQGSASYIVKGRGNSDSFMSCSHGAGRKMSKKEATGETKTPRSLNLDEEKRKLDERGIIHSIRTVKDLAEATGSYKDIDVVMKEQEDLVQIVTKLEPLAVVKG
jgi:tRNA-splicing ligase RtcB